MVSFVSSSSSSSSTLSRLKLSVKGVEVFSARASFLPIGICFQRIDQCKRTRSSQLNDNKPTHINNHCAVEQQPKLQVGGDGGGRQKRSKTKHDVTRETPRIKVALYQLAGSKSEKEFEPPPTTATK